MKISGKNLLNALNSFGDHLKADIGAVAPAQVYITTDGKELGLYCHRSTFDGYISFDLDEPTEEKWCVVVSAEDFVKFVKLVSNATLYLSVKTKGENISLIVEFDKKEYEFKAIRTEYMGMDVSGATKIANIKGKDLIAAVGAVGYAVSKNQSKPQLKSVHFSFNKDNGVMIVETLDSIRIAQYRSIAPEILETGEVIAKKDDISFFTGLDAETEYTIARKKNIFILSAPHFQVAITQICEDFYNLEKIIDRTTKNSINVAKTDLIAALKRVMIFGSLAVITEWSEDGLRIIAEEDKGRAEEFIPAGKNPDISESITVAVNPGLLLEAAQNAALNDSENDIIYFALTTKNLFRLQTLEYLAIVLPVRK